MKWNLELLWCFLFVSSMSNLLIVVQLSKSFTRACAYTVQLLFVKCICCLTSSNSGRFEVFPFIRFYSWEKRGKKLECKMICVIQMIMKSHRMLLLMAEWRSAVTAPFFSQNSFTLSGSILVLHISISYNRHNSVAPEFLSWVKPHSRTVKTLIGIPPCICCFYTRSIYTRSTTT